MYSRSHGEQQLCPALKLRSWSNFMRFGLKCAVMPQNSNNDTPCIRLRNTSFLLWYIPCCFVFLQTAALTIVTLANKTIPFPLHSEWLPNGYRSNKTKLFFLSSETWSYRDREHVFLHNRIIGSRQFQTDPFSPSIHRPFIFSHRKADKYFFSLHKTSAASASGPCLQPRPSSYLYRCSLKVTNELTDEQRNKTLLRNALTKHYFVTH
jgi:hypothetical protein